MPRPRKHLPVRARERLLTMAEDGPVTETRLCKCLDLAFPTWQRLKEENETAKEIWEELKAIQRDRVLDKMYRRAIDDGDTNAGAFVLRALHEVSERGTEGEERPGVVINLSAPLSRENYMEFVGKTPPKALDHE